VKFHDSLVIKSHLQKVNVSGAGTGERVKLWLIYNVYWMKSMQIFRYWLICPWSTVESVAMFNFLKVNQNFLGFCDLVYRQKIYSGLFYCS
jgi:hypothetical protein